MTRAEGLETLIGASLLHQEMYESTISMKVGGLRKIGTRVAAYWVLQLPTYRRRR